MPPNEAFSQEIMPITHRDKMPQGILLESVTRSKDSEELSSYTTTAVRKERFIVDNTEFSPVTKMERH